jgi:serine/threonine-protein kinase
MFDLTAALVLAPDVELVAAATLSEAGRRRLGCEVSDLLLSKQRSRSRSKVVAGEAVDFVRRFQSPVTLTVAVRDIASASGRTPAALLEALFPLIAGLVNDGYLVTLSELPAAARTPQFGTGRVVADFEIVRCVQIYEDTELYQVRAGGRFAAMKVARSVRPEDAAELGREAEIHARLAGEVAPRLLARGDIEGHAFFAVEWRPGKDVAAFADAIRAGGQAARPALLDLCIAVLDAFARLHGRKLVHGDVHPGNILVADDGAIAVIDYGLARFLDGPDGGARAPRGGVGFFLDPGYAAARLAGVDAPTATPHSDQYALACLVYLLVAGRPYLDFSFDETTAYRQIRDVAPRPFAAAKAESWPALEAVLAVALDKTPRRRFDSMAAFAEALRRIRDTAAYAGAGGTSDAVPVRSADPVGASLGLLLADTLARLGPGLLEAAADLRDPPTASVHSGASGIAYALYRIACARDDTALLAAADLWSCRAMAVRDQADAYFDPANDITPESVGHVSLVHSVTGTAYVHALVALSAGNVVTAQRAVGAFVAAGRRPCRNPDLFLGQAGLLVACATLLEAVAGEESMRSSPLFDLGGRLAAQIADHLADQLPIGRGPVASVGMAHGWSGQIYALLRWSDAAGTALPDNIEARLDQLAACTRPEADGIRWPIRIGREGDRDAPFDHMPGWCNGGAGHVHTFLLASARLGRRDLLDVAVSSGSQAIADSLSRGASFLCCGATGVAYAALALFRATGETRWLQAAVRLAEAAAVDIRSPLLPWTSLFRGAIGTSLLVADLARPEDAVMPVFGGEA